MKKHLIILLAALLVLSMMLAACAKTVETAETSANTDSSSDSTTTDGSSNSESDESSSDSESTDASSDSITDDESSDSAESSDETEKKDETDKKDDPDETEERYGAIESYMPENVSSELKRLFEGREIEFKAINTTSNPYVIRDVYNISNCGVKSISIPVISTEDADENGDFTFTIYVLQNEWMKGLGQTPRRSYEIKINAEEYGLEENDSTVYKWIKVDLTDYEIELTQTETLGFVGDDDTIFAGYLGSGADRAIRLIETNFPQMRGYVKDAGQKDITHSVNNNILIYDFEFIRYYESEAAYEEYVSAEEAYLEKIDSLFDLYVGKKLSILGDSISTFANISNNTSYNSTIGGNAVYNSKGSASALNNNGLYDEKDSYWHRLLTDLGMELCVNNSYSGDCVINNGPSRALQLHNNDGENPDVILFYMGINDLHNNKPMGDLYRLLANTADTRSDAEKIEEWLASDEFTGSATFEQAYAKSIMNMLDKYKGVEVWCLSLLSNNDSRFTTTKMKPERIFFCCC